MLTRGTALVCDERFEGHDIRFVALHALAIALLVRLTVRAAR